MLRCIFPLINTIIHFYCVIRSQTNSKLIIKITVLRRAAERYRLRPAVYKTQKVFRLSLRGTTKDNSVSHERHWTTDTALCAKHLPNASVL